MANQTIKLAVGGPVQAKYGTYLLRPADKELLNACQAGKFAYVLACRQIGKSSLMFETSEKLSQMGIRTALIDLNSIGQSLEADSWYFSLIDEIARRLGLNVDVQDWWEERPRLSTLTHRFLQFLREVVLEKISSPIVIFVDEIDMTLGLGFTDDFFAAIRSVYHERAQDPTYHRLTFVLLGVATPDELIKDHTRTPFNIGQAITLRDFTKEECDPFRLAVETKYPEDGRDYFDQIYDWTGGHPYLTQKLCDALLKVNGLPAIDHPDPIEALVRRLFLAAEARAEDNIQFVQTRVISDPYAQDMLKIYKRILEENPVPDDEQSPPINRLKLYGLVAARNGKLEIRNKLYAHAFGETWVDEVLTSIRSRFLGRYKILQEIGQGGFATVYLAQLQDSGQTVALKVLKSPGTKDTTQVKRFKQEARAVARLEHPNIIRILETSGDEEPSFIAMEYVPGGTLRDKLKAGPLPRHEAMHIIRQIASALTYAHQQGIIHRDVNPNNILLDTSQEPVRPVLTDFGLVKLLLRDEHTQISSTSIIGTLDYMAPEQWRQETPTPTTDLYALALTFFEILSGRRPFGSQSSYYELMNKHLDENLPLLSNMIPEVGPFFDDVLRRATAKDPANRFDSVANFMEALEAANAQAEEVERATRQNQAAKMVEAAQSYIQKSRYNPDRALAMIEAALETYPECVEALRLKGKIRLQQEQLDRALEDYRQAFEQVMEPASEIGLEYLELLSQTAGTFWERQQFPEGVKHYETIRQILADEAEQVAPIQDIWQKARTRLIEYYFRSGDTAYASVDPECIDETISTLKKEIGKLEALKSEAEMNNLQDKLKQLQVTKYENIIKAAQLSIEDTSSRDSQTRFANEEIFQHYATLDGAYQALLALEPENEHWQKSRRKKLKEKAEARYVYAIRALNKLEPDYEAGLRHYKAILEIEQQKYPGLTQELRLNLTEKVADLERKADYDGKYNEIRALMEKAEYAKALEHLDQEFIRMSNYEHRDVAKLLWGLIYAKQHEGHYPPEWEGLAGFELLSKRLVGLEQGRVQQLKERLEPWSQTKIFETIDRENKTLRGFEEQVKSIEALIDEAVTHGIAEPPEIEVCRNELMAVRAQIQEQHSVIFQIEVNEIVHNSEAWLQKIEDIEALLKTGNPVKDVPEFFNQLDEVQAAIEGDLILERLRMSLSTNAEIGQTINQLKLRIREQLVGILIGDIGRRDEELVKTRKEVTKAREKLAQSQAEAAKAREELAALPQKVDALERELEKFTKQHEINRYLIPFSLILAVLVGGAIAAQIESLRELFIIPVIAFILLIAYSFYYIWVYYISSSRSE